MSTMWRSRWAAVGAAVAITLGAGGIGIVDATKSSGERAVYTAIEPCRLLDTRADQGIGGRTTPLGPGEVYTITAHGNNGQCTGIPTDTLALELNVTGLQNTGRTHLTIWSGAGDAPNASHVNLAPGAAPTPNSVTTELDGATFAIRNNSATTNVIIDVVGIYQDHNHDDRYYTESESNLRFDDSHAAFDATSGNQALTGGDDVLATVTVDTPTSGYVVLNTGGFLWGDAGAVGVNCSITGGTTVDLSSSVNVDVESSDRASLATNRTFQINKFFLLVSPDESTYNFVCDRSSGAGGQASDIQLSAIFVPDPDAFENFITPPIGLDQIGPGPEDS